MSKQEAGYDYHRYKQLLAEATDDTKRLELIDLMIKEDARDRLEAQRTSDRVAMTAVTLARILGAGERRDDSRPDGRVCQTLYSHASKTELPKGYARAVSAPRRSHAPHLPPPPKPQPH